MGFFDFLTKFFSRNDNSTPRSGIEDREGKKRVIEIKIAEAQLRLAREKDKANPDPLRVDKFEREIAVWKSVLEKEFGTNE